MINNHLENRVVGRRLVAELRAACAEKGIDFERYMLDHKIKRFTWGSWEKGDTVPATKFLIMFAKEGFDIQKVLVGC